MSKHPFTESGVNAMYKDSLDLIFSAIMGTNKDYDINDLSIKISIGNQHIEIPIDSAVFEELDIFMSNALKAYREAIA